ncbi:MAG: CBS domain-containing protein [Anaerolineae bacterium]|nr:CBS domain-containing protein [Anaerolineae bacterium]
MKLILTHPNSDFDAVAASLAAYKLNPESVPVLPDRLNRNVYHFLTLFGNGLPFVSQQEFHASRDVTDLILVDTQRLPGISGLKKHLPVEIIDHHHPFTRDDLKPYETLWSEQVGATTTLLVEQIQRQNIPLTTLEATLMALGIYEDTGSLSYGTTTARDIRAAAWLLEQKAALDTVRRFLAPPLNEEQQELFETLMSNAESRVIQGHTITIATARVDEHIPEISSVVHRLRDVLDPAALFVLVQMPNNLLLVGRSSGSGLDVGEIARLYGGGGHDRASAATLYNQSIAEVLASLWPHIRTRVRPVTRVADLMSFGAQTVEASQKVGEVAQQLRRIGHEGYPVLDQGRVVGLLTRRELDRALEHQLGDLALRDIMTAGEITLVPDDSVLVLEQRMVESGWGQIPVLNDNNQLLGIVTRTDLIKHWASTHPTRLAVHPAVSTDRIRDVLGESVAQLIEAIATEADAIKLSMYVVGGAVRDLMLNRANLDLDFVVESSAIQLAARLQSHYGGEIYSYKPFGTAKWLIDSSAAEVLGVRVEDLPDHVDFATARNEFYEHPTALPTVYQSSIKLDLQRRDFTINTLAIQLSPEAASGQVLDFYGGLADLQAGLIRVLHSLSFVDDPTRILRAMRFECRLDFQIEPRTAELITSALPMLRRITGERIRNELDLLLCEAQPGRALLRMQAQGILEAIHPAFQVPPDIAARLEVGQRQAPPWPHETPDRAALYWHILVTTIAYSELGDFCERLMFGRRVTVSLLDAAGLVQQINGLGEADMRPSQVVEYLDGITELALLTAWMLTDNPVIRDRIGRYQTTWRWVQPTTTGHDLRALGLPSGPCYSVILKKLRVARLDDKIRTDADETRLLHTLVDEACHDDS